MSIEMLQFRSNITWISRNGVNYYSCGEFESLCSRYATKAILSNHSKYCLFWEPSIDAFAAFVGCMLAGKTPCYYSIPNYKLDRHYFEEQFNALSDQKLHLVGSSQMAKTLDLPFFEPADITSSSSNLHTLQQEEDHPLFMQFSSGTTSIRKRLSYTEEQLFQHNLEYSNALGLTEHDIVISWLPHYHDMGLIATLLMPLQLGMDLILMSNFDWVGKPQMFIEACRTQKATIAWQPNFAYDLLTQRCEPADLSQTRFINCAEPVFEHSCSNFERIFSTTVLGCYALAENVFAVTQADSKDTFGPYRTSGRAFGSNKVRVLNDEIQIQSSHLFSSYDSGESSNISDGWYTTGDQGAIINEQLFVQGRLDDIFKIRGQKIIPDIIEQTANTIPGVRAGRVACIPIIGGSGQVTSASLLYEGDQSEQIVLNQLAKFGIDRCSRVPDGWLIKSSSGKISRRSSALKFRDDPQFRTLTIEIATRTILARVLQMSADKINDTINMHDTGQWNSLRHIELVVALEEAFNLEFENHELAELRSLRAIREVISRKTPYHKPF